VTLVSDDPLFPHGISGILVAAYTVYIAYVVCLENPPWNIDLKSYSLVLFELDS
jgi:hypothetical protein